MEYPLDKYRFIVVGNKVIALSTYAGRRVRGVARCSPDDSFSLDTGKKLAAARCAVKVADRRVKRAMGKVEQANQAFFDAYLHQSKMINYCDDALKTRAKANHDLDNLLANLKK